MPYNVTVRQMRQNGGCSCSLAKQGTVEPRSTDNRLIRTPGYYGKFFTKILYIFRKITPVNTDNGHFSLSRMTNSRTSSTSLYGHWLSVHRLFYVLMVGLVLCSNNGRLLRVRRIYYIMLLCHVVILCWMSLFLLVFDSCTVVL